MVEKDYALGWILYGIASSNSSKDVAFKGGTSLSKLFFPGKWRISEDLDFTLLSQDFERLTKSLKEEVPGLVEEASKIRIQLKNEPFTNPNYLQCRLHYTGPIGRNSIRVDATMESYLGDIAERPVPKQYDYVSFDVLAYSLENVLSEKMRTILQRGKIKDYYDAWKLTATETIDKRKVKLSFNEKCKSKGVHFRKVDDFFPADVITKLKSYYDVGLARLTSEPLPPLQTMLNELRTKLEEIMD